MKKITLLFALLVCTIGFSQTAAEGWVSPDGQSQTGVQDSKVAIFEMNHGHTAGASLTVADGSQASSQEILESNYGHTAGASIAAPSTNYVSNLPANSGFERSNLSARTGSGTLINGQDFVPCAFENPSETITNGLGMEAVNLWSMADDFDVAANEDYSPETLTFEYLNFNPNTLVDVTVTFHEDAAGLPGAVVATTGALVPTAQTVIGAAFGRDNIQAVVDLTGSGVVLPGGAAGTKYWVALAGNSGGGDTAFWTAGDTINGLESAFSADAGATWATSTVAFGQAFGVFMNLEGDCAPVGGGGPCAFENPSETITNGLGMEAVNLWSMADDFDVAANENYTAETLTFEYLNFNPNMLVDVTVTFHEDAAGLPGAVVATTGALVPTAQTVIGAAFGRDNIQAVVDLTGSGVVLPGGAAGTKYWVALAGNSGGGDTAFWTAGDTINGLESAFSADAGATWATSTVAFGQAFGVFMNLEGDCAPVGGGGPCAFENPSETITNGLGMEAVNLWSMADDIDVPADTDFTPEMLTFEYLNFNPNTLVDVTVTFHEDAAGLPGAVVATTGALVPTSQTVIGAAFGRDNIQAVVDLTGSGVLLPGGAAGTKYWVALAGNSGGGDTAFWTAGDTINGLESAFSADAGATWATSTVAFGQAFGVFFNIEGDCATIGGGVCTSMTYDATGLPLDIDGAATSTADCAGAPNLVPINVAEVGTIGVDADFENLTINITHTFTADLDIFLVAPTGEEIELTTDNGGGGDNFTDTVFEDGGADITAGSAPFTGTFQPEGGTFAAAFAGVSITGEWNLRLCDDAGGDTGTIDSVSMNLCVPEQPLTNNECGGATPVACDDVVVGDTSDNTDNGGNNAAPDEWYSFTGTGAPQFVTVSLCDGGTTYDSRLTVFDECGGTIIATNDDSCGLQSELSFVSDGTSTYYIAIEGFGAGDVGPFSMAITCNDVAANDLCSNAEAISCGDTVAGSTTFATDDIGVAPDCDTPTTAPGVWYVYTDTTGLVTDITLTTCDDADYDTKISVYTGDCGAPPLTCVAGNDDDADCTGFTSTVEFQSDGASTYYILVHGFNTATGNFNLTMDCVPVPPDNDLIANAIDLDEVGCPFTDPDVAMPAATLEAGNPTDCDISGANGVWYKFTPLGDGFITGTVASPAGFTSVTFYTADDESATEGDLTRVDWFENQCLPSDFGRIPFVANQTYYCFVVNSGGRSDIVFSECETLSTADNTIEGFSFYPNPADETINLASVELIETVEVYNLLGQKVMSQEVNTTNTQIDVTTLSQGAYLMKVSVNGQVGTYKIIKK